jgi:PII-like signaling protein
MRHSGRPVLSVALALVFGYSLTIAPMLRSGSRTGCGDPNRPLHDDRIRSLSPDLPVAVVIVDTPEKVDAFLPRLQELVTDGLITVDDLRAIGRGAPLCHPGGAPQSFDRRPVTVRPRGCGQASQVPRVQPRPTAPNPPSRLAATLATA